MSEVRESERISLPFPLRRAGEQATLNRFLTYLVFEGHGLRIGLELSSCVLSYTLLSLLVPWQQLGVPLRWSTLVSWFGCCFAIILFDQLILCRSVYTFRKAYLLGLQGAFGKALDLLEKIGPGSGRVVRLPQNLYHLQRAEVLMNSESFAQAEAELSCAELSGASPEQMHLARSRYYRARGNYDSALAELEAGTVACGENSVLKLEEGIALLEERRDFRSAKRILKHVLELPEAPHPAGESTHDLARAYLNVARLWTGEAEEAIEDLYRSVDRLRSAVVYVDTLRPVLAQILLERSYYFATHKEPSSALIDLRVALSLCSYAPHLRRAAQVKEELQWRHNLTAL